MEDAVVTGIAHDTSEVKLTIRGVPDRLVLQPRCSRNLLRTW